jgi:hypothetical protein
VNLQEKKKTLPLSGTCEQSIAPPAVFVVVY